MQQVFQFYADPGHGWMAVKKQLLVGLGIASKITTYSYQRGDTAYLEEDRDLGMFFEAYLQKTGEIPILKQHHSDRSSKIRNYESYTCDSEVFRVVATVHDPRTDEGAHPEMELKFGSLEAATRQAKSWSHNGYWSAVYAKESGEAFHDFAPSGSLQ